MLKGLERKMYKELLRSLGLFSLEETEGRTCGGQHLPRKGNEGAGADLSPLW